jgi:alkylation response protein AidB-like acyl-CoA dehydrogenase
MRASLFAAARFAAIHARDAVRRAYELGGTSALYVDCPLERAHRDVHAACQHIILNELWLEDAGRVWLGGAPASPMFVS